MHIKIIFKSKYLIYLENWQKKHDFFQNLGTHRYHYYENLKIYWNIVGNSIKLIKFIKSIKLINSTDSSRKHPFNIKHRKKMKIFQKKTKNGINFNFTQFCTVQVQQNSKYGKYSKTSKFCAKFPTWKKKFKC